MSLTGGTVPVLGPDLRPVPWSGPSESKLWRSTLGGLPQGVADVVAAHSPYPSMRFI